jgi:hypothetical protein
LKQYHALRVAYWAATAADMTTAVEQQQTMSLRRGSTAWGWLLTLSAIKVQFKAYSAVGYRSRKPKHFKQIHGRE